MLTPEWQLQTPLSAIVFDCDGTLSAIEGIDELAKENKVGAKVQALTETAMGQTGINPTLYSERLDLVRPSEQQVKQLGQHYFAKRVPHASDVIHLLTRLQKAIYLVSAGLNPAVTIFGELLPIPRAHIFAVNLTFDQEGRFKDFDHTSPLIQNDGKRLIVAQIKKQHANLAHVGDGLNDIATHDLVTRFIGYGGVFYRENIAVQCKYYLRALSMAALLPLVLTVSESQKLCESELRIYQQGLALLHAADDAQD